MVKPGTMFPDPPHPIFCLTASPPDIAGSTHIMPYLRDSYKHIALFIIADHPLHEPHPLFQKFAAICKPYRNSLRPTILARAYYIGGFRKPDWSDDDILFLVTNNAIVERSYGLNGKDEMGLLIIRPDGYIAYSTPVDPNGHTLEMTDRWLMKILVRLQK